MSLLIKAIKANRVDEALRLLQDKEIRETASENNNDALRFAATNGLTAIVIELLKIKAVQENAGADNNYALRWAATNGLTAIVIELLKIKAVQENAGANDNEALRLAAQNGHTAVVIELLKLKAVQENAGADNNYALRWAARSGYSAIVIELLKLKAVQENAGANDNEALRLAARYGDWFLLLELLKTAAVRKHLASDLHHALRGALAAGELGVVSLIMDIYNEQNILIPEEVTAEFKTRSESLLAQNKDIRSMATLLTNLFKYNGEGFLDLLKDKKLQNCAAQGNNLALIFWARNGHTAVVIELLKLKEIQENATVEDNLALRLAAQHGHYEVVLELLNIEPVRRLAAAKNNEVFYHVLKFQYLPVISELLKIDAVRSTLASKEHEILRLAVEAGGSKALLLLIYAYKEQGLPFPADLKFTFGEGCVRSLSDFEGSLRKASEDVFEALSTWPRPLVDITLEYADLSAKLDKALTFKPLLPSAGSLSEESSGIEKLTGNLGALKPFTQGFTDS